MRLRGSRSLFDRGYPVQFEIGDRARPRVLSTDGLRVERDVCYHPRPEPDARAQQSLDIYAPATAQGDDARFPVVLFMHGGGWRAADKRDALSIHANVCTALARRGLLALNINYRLSPRARHPAHALDVAGALCWTRENIAGFGGDADNIFLSGHILMIDLRSDTVTKPTPRMRRAMADAEVGDDVYGEDPTVNRLQERAAEIFGKEAALFVPTGSMGNQIAVKLHTRPGTEVVIEERGHIFNFEMAALSAISGTLARPVKSRDGSGILSWADIEAGLHTGGAYYVAPTGLVALENSHNLAGGSVMTRARTEELCERAHALGLPVHLDGARIFNASAALDEPVAALAHPADSVMFCLSKGLGAPVGSMLLGTRAFIEEARRWRKLLGGGMRQVGVLAAAGLVALEDTPQRLHEDHEHAQLLARGVAELPGVSIDPERVRTNIVIFDVAATNRAADEICARLAERGVLASGFGTAIRMVTHYDIARADVETALKELQLILGSPQPGAGSRKV
jgi:threonine aldolase